jgi:hypothetical protein
MIALQVGRKGPGDAVDIAEAKFLAQKAVGDLVAVLLKAFLQQGHQRAVLGGVDVRRYAGRVGLQPGAGRRGCGHAEVSGLFFGLASSG